MRIDTVWVLPVASKQQLCKKRNVGIAARNLYESGTNASCCQANFRRTPFFQFKPKINKKLMIRPSRL